jgi:hypothetical protein
VWKCHQDAADVVVVVEEEEVAEDLPLHVIPGVIFISYTISKILKFHVLKHFIHHFDILKSVYDSVIMCVSELITCVV